MYILADFGLLRDLKYKIVKGVRGTLEKGAENVLARVLDKNKNLFGSEEAMAKRVAAKIKKRQGLPNYKTPALDSEAMTIAIHGLGGGRRNKNMLAESMQKVPEVKKAVGEIVPLSPRSLRYKKGFTPSSPSEFLGRIAKASYSPDSLGEAQYVANKVIEARRQGKKVNVVGHSMGGKMTERVARILDKAGFNDENIKYTSLAGFRPRSEDATNVPNFKAIRGKRDNALPKKMFKGDEEIIPGAKHDTLSLLTNPIIKKKFQNKELVFSKRTNILR